MIKREQYIVTRYFTKQDAPLGRISKEVLIETWSIFGIITIYSRETIIFP